MRPLTKLSYALEADAGLASRPDIWGHISEIKTGVSGCAKEVYQEGVVMSSARLKWIFIVYWGERATPI
jgi:hypothetical protein